MPGVGGDRVCDECIADPYLRKTVVAAQTIARCSFGHGEGQQTVSVAHIAPIVVGAFERRYRPGQIEEVWQSDGAPDTLSQEGDFAEACIEALGLGAGAARAIVQWLAANHDPGVKAGRTPWFDGQTRFERFLAPAATAQWRDLWKRFEDSCKHDGRFFAPDLREALDELFGSFTLFGESPILTVGPTHQLSRIYRARAVNSKEEAQALGKNVARELGPPPPSKATPGRMNAGGISVFYGAFSSRVAVAELRPRIGGLLAVARFKLIRPVRLLDFAAFTALGAEDSAFRSDLEVREAKRAFLRNIGAAIARPVQPHEELLDYVPTQVLAEYVHHKHNVDGLIYPSAQFGEVLESQRRRRGRDSNVVLFHHAARIEGGSDLPLGDQADARPPTLQVETSESAVQPERFRLVEVTRIVVETKASFLPPPVGENGTSP